MISQRKRPVAFVSHVSEDKQLIRPYLERLISAGIDLYIDRPEEIWKEVPSRIKRIYCGADWNDEIDAAVRSVDHVIAFLSERYLSKYDAHAPPILYREVDLAKQLKKLLPIVIDDFSNVTNEQRSWLLRHFQPLHIFDVAISPSSSNLVGINHPRFETLISQIKETNHSLFAIRPRPTCRPSIFVDRTSLRTQVVSKLNSAIAAKKSNVFILRGPSGSGKSTLAWDICDEISADVHNVQPSREADLASVHADDVVFVDGFMDDRLPRDKAAEWLRDVPARIVLMTTRLLETKHVVDHVFGTRDAAIEEIQVGGFTQKEFLLAIDACKNAPGCTSLELTEEQVDLVFKRTGGLPLAVQLLFKLIDGSSTAFSNALFFVATLAPDEVLAKLIELWRLEIDKQDEDLRRVLFVLANVPTVGMSDDAIGHVLGWPVERAARCVLALWSQGFVSQVDLNDNALRLHDSLKIAFLALDLEAPLVATLRRRYSDYGVSAPTPKSAISMADSLMRASEHLFAGIKDDAVNDMPSHRVILELERLQRNFTGNDKNSEFRAKRLVSWLAKYLNDHVAHLHCSEVIALAMLALSLPIASSELAEAFTPLWETGRERDPTKVSTALVASAHHWRHGSREDGKIIFERLEHAFDCQSWGSFGGSPDLVAAGFAAAYATLGRETLGAACLSGYTIRGGGISYREGFSVILLSMEARGDRSGANTFLHSHGDFCRDLDAVTTTYLGYRGVLSSSQYGISDVEENLNRQALLGLWSKNRKYYDLVQHLASIATLRPGTPPIYVISRLALDKAARSFASP